MPTSTGRSLPHLLKDQTSSNSPSRSELVRVLRYIDRWREWMYQTWRGEGANNPAEAPDDLLSIVVLLHYCAQRWEPAQQCKQLLRDGQCWTSVKGFAEFGRKMLPGLIGRTLFPDTEFTSVDEVPKAIRESDWSRCICGALDQLFDGRLLPAWFFGDLHQLCVARPLMPQPEGDGSGQSDIRYSRGIHYTPAPVVDYLVARTLADCEFDLTVHSPTILDPSCGTGNILLAAFRWLCSNTTVAENAHLADSLNARLDMLCKSIAGRDIDGRAIAWTRRGLVLQACEDSWEAAADVDVEDVVGRLERNICHADYLTPRDTECTRLGDRDVEFIIGGPPFVRLSELRRSQPDRIAEYQRRYRSARGQFDLYMLFVEESLRRLSASGRMALSVANTFLRTSSGRALRELLGAEASVLELVEFEDSKLYPDAVTQILLLFAERRGRNRPTRHVWVRSGADLRSSLECAFAAEGENADIIELDCDACRGPQWSLHGETDAGWLEKLRSDGIPFSAACEVLRGGWSSGHDDTFIMRRVGDDRASGAAWLKHRRTREERLIETRWLRPILHGRNVHGYSDPQPINAALLPFDADGCPVTADALQASSPNLWAYLAQHRDDLESATKRTKTPWYCPRTCPDHVAGPLRLIGPKVTAGSSFTVLQDQAIIAHSTLLEIVPHPTVDPWLLLAILNSNVFWRYIQMTMPTMGHGRHVLRLERVKEVPLPPRALWTGADAQHAAELAQLSCESSADADQLRVNAAIERLYGIA